MNLVPIERVDPLWEDNPVHRSCQVWSRTKYFWMMIQHIKNFCCKDVVNELKSYHNKTDWVNFVLMQDFWLQLKSDSTAWQKTLKNSHNSTDSVACREYTLPRDEDSSEPTGWIRGNTKIGFVLEVTTCCLQAKYGVELRIKSVNKDNTHSWVRISHSLNKLVTNLNNKDQDDNEQETSEMQFEDYALKLNASDFASRSKAKAKPQRRDSASSSTRTIPIGERTWIDIEPQKYSVFDYHSVEEIDPSSSSWKSTSRQWWSDWILENRRLSSGSYCVLSSLVWREVEEQHGRRRTQEKIPVLYWFIRNNSVPPSSPRSFRTQCHSFRTAGQCLIPNDFFESFITSDVQSIYTPSKNWAKDRRYFFTSVDPMNKEHKDPDVIDLDAPRLAWYKQKVWKKHQNTVYWVYIKLAQKKGFQFFQTTSNVIIFCDTLSLLYPRRLSWWDLEKSCTRKYVRHLDFLQRFPWNVIGGKNWAQKLLEMVKTHNKPNQRPKIQL